MTKEQIIEARNHIAELGGYKKITNFIPDVWDNGKRKITSLSFDKPTMFGELMNVVSDIEQSKDLIIDVKRCQCSIIKMHLTRNQKFINIDGGTSKQMAIFKALSELYNTTLVFDNL